MTRLLEEAFEQAAALPDSEQDRLAQWLIDELDSEHRWQQAFAGSQDALEKLAEEALAEHRAGKTKPLNPDDL